MEDKNERFQLVVPSSVLDRVKALALKERRSISNMIVVLLVEALNKREGKTKDESGDSLPALLAA